VATYSDVYKEISWNHAWLDKIGLSNAKWFSGKGLIPPAITGCIMGMRCRLGKIMGCRMLLGIIPGLFCLTLYAPFRFL
jgi:hypothetical protein